MFHFWDEKKVVEQEESVTKQSLLIEPLSLIIPLSPRN